MTRFEKRWGTDTGKGLAQKQPEQIGRRVILSPSFLLAQAVFEPTFFPYQYPRISQT
jgi:hypothetical protein